MRQRTLTLTQPQRDELLHRRDHDPKPYIRERAAALLLIADGVAPHAVAASRLLRPRDPDTVYAWLDRYQEEGLAGLTGHAHGGNRRRPFRRGRRRGSMPPPGTR
jgi:hypothetical protein